jgi:tRNA A-37 threonylcarbamoyl transferase component Bud32
MKNVPNGYRSEELGKTQIVAREDVLEFVKHAINESKTLFDYAARHPDAEAVKGRQTLYMIPGPGAVRWVVRQLSHGGLLAPITRKRFLKSDRPRPFNELLLSVRLQQLDIRTPNVVAAVVYPSGLSYGGEVAREKIENALDLADCLFGKDDLEPMERAGALAAAGRLIGELHREDVLHPDLNLKNILIQSPTGQPRAYILDIEKSEIVSDLSGSQRENMLARFSRSAHKFEHRAGRRISADEWKIFRAAYKEGRVH